MPEISENQIDQVVRQVNLPLIDLLSVSEFWRTILIKESDSYKADYEQIQTSIYTELENLEKQRNHIVMTDIEYKNAIELIRNNRESLIKEAVIKATNSLFG
jgi:hypothetical protein